jgi:hypothetical protein
MRGPKRFSTAREGAHQFELYSPAGMIVTHRSGALEGWSIEEGLRQAQQGGTAMIAADSGRSPHRKWRPSGWPEQALRSIRP